MSTIQTIVSASSNLGGHVKAEFVFCGKNDKDVFNTTFVIESGNEDCYLDIINELVRINVDNKSYVRVSEKDVFG